MNKKRIIFACGVLVYLMVIWFVDPFVLVMTYLWLGWLLLLGLGIVGAKYLIQICLKESCAPAFKMLKAWLLVLLLSAVAWPVNAFSSGLAEAEAKAYPEKVAPYLDEYRLEHGAYPQSLDELPSKPRLPRMLAPNGYRPEGTWYSFSFSQPGGLLGGWDYDSRTKQWNLSD